MAGMFNAGVTGAMCTEETLRFLDWWERQLRTHCLEDVQRAFHSDQRWLDLAPAFVAGLCLLRDLGINAAYWRLPWLDLQLRGGAFHAGEQPLRLFHFSGFDPRRPEEVTRFHPGWRVEESGAAELFRLYHRMLLEAGWNEAHFTESGGPELWRVWHFLRRLRSAARRARRNPRVLLEQLQNAGSRRASHPSATRSGSP